MAQSTSSSSVAASSSNWRSLIARCSAREKRQRLCSVMSLDSRTGCETQRKSRNGLNPAANAMRVPQGLLPFYLKLQIMEIDGKAIGIFALHTCDNPVNLRGC